jgi:DNA repair/transcription protein MET18/MMS19
MASERLPVKSPQLSNGLQLTLVLSDPRSQTAYLVALTSLIKSVPKTMYIHEMHSVGLSIMGLCISSLIQVQLMPLLLRGLELPDNDVRASAIDTLLSTAGDHAEQSVVSEHASTLVSAMLKNVLVQDMPSMVSSHDLIADTN